MTSPLDTQQYWQQEDQKKRQRDADAKARGVIHPWTERVDYQGSFDQRRNLIDTTSQAGVESAKASAAKRAYDRSALEGQQIAQQGQWASQDLARSYKVASWQQQQQALKDRAAMQARIDQYGRDAQAAANRVPTGPAGQNFAGGGGTPAGRSRLDFGNSTYNQIAAWAQQAGWSDAQIPTVISIAMAESGGQAHGPDNVNPDAHNSHDMGLMQINSYWQRDKLGQGVDVYDPVTNLRLAKQVFDEGGWGQWSTMKNGAAAKFVIPKPTVTAVPTTVPSQTVNTPNGLRNTIISTGMRAIGLPYNWGGQSWTAGFDCSHLVLEAYQQAGISIPLGSSGGAGTAQAEVSGLLGSTSGIHGVATSIANLQPGDLIGWTHKWAGPDWIGHIAIYAGNNEIIEAAGGGIPVQRRPLRQSDYQYATGIHVTLPGD